MLTLNDSNVYANEVQKLDAILIHEISLKRPPALGSKMLEVMSVSPNDSLHKSLK